MALPCPIMSRTLFFLLFYFFFVNIKRYIILVNLNTIFCKVEFDYNKEIAAKGRGTL